jgi:hypothetical protein
VNYRITEVNEWVVVHPSGKFRTPTVIVRGAVVNLGRELHWFHETLFDYPLGGYAVMQKSVEI